MGYILFLASLLLLGGVMSLVVLLPPLRRLGRSSPKARAVEISVLGLLSFSIAFPGYSRIGAEVTYIFGTITPPGYESSVMDKKEEIVQELWVRFIMPPPLQSPCYTSQVEVCELADGIGGSDHGRNGWGDYLISVGWCLIPAFVSGVFTWFFTRKAKAVSSHRYRLFQMEG